MQLFEHGRQVGNLGIGEAVDPEKRLAAVTETDKEALCILGKPVIRFQKTQLFFRQNM